MSIHSSLHIFVGDMRVTAAIVLLLTTASKVQGFRPLARQTVLPFARAMSSEIPNTVEEWKSKLNAEQFEVLRRKATEPPGYSERKEGQLEYELKKNYGTKYPEKGNGVHPRARHWLRDERRGREDSQSVSQSVSCCRRRPPTGLPTTR